MQKTIHSSLRITFVAFALAAFTLTALAQPGPPTAAPATTGKPGPGGGPPMPMPGMMAPGASASEFPSMLTGIISPEEYRKYVAFQQHLSDDPAIKELNAKIAETTKELQRLRAEAGAVRERLTDANWEIKAIRDKIMTVMFPRGGPGPSPMPAPGKGN